MANRFKGFALSKWQQFESINIDFHDSLTVFTGANASGKTTILNILAKHRDWQVQSCAVPIKSRVTGAFKFLTRFFFGQDLSSDNKIGQIKYDNGQTAELLIPKTDSPHYEINISNKQPVSCFFVPSHRAVFRYQQVTTIPTQISTRQEAFQRVYNTTKTRYFGGSSESSSFHMKETLLAWNIFGRGNEDMPPDGAQLNNFLGFQEVLRKIMPPEVGFRKLSIRKLEIVMECDSGEFLIDAASGGLSSLIDLVWQIYMFQPDQGEVFTVLIDEIENHLHPTMQRRILPDLIKTFPSVQYIVSTHNPLILGSVKDSAVYALRFNENKRVFSDKLDLRKEVRTATEVLREVLGVSFTMPLWAEEMLNNIIAKYSAKPITSQLLQQMRKELDTLGLSSLVPEAISSIIDNSSND